MAGCPTSSPSVVPTSSPSLTPSGNPSSMPTASEDVQWHYGEWNTGDGCLSMNNAYSKYDIQTLEDCKNECVKDFDCKSLDWSENGSDKRCHISYTTQTL